MTSILRTLFLSSAPLVAATVHAGMPVMAAYWSAREKPSAIVTRTYPDGVLPGIINKLILTHAPFEDLAKVEASPEWKANLPEYRALRARGVAIWVMISNASKPDLEPQKSPAFIRNLVAFCERNGIDGIDVDFEGRETVGHKNYNPFVCALADALHAKGKKISVAANATGTFDLVSDATLGKLDYILPMAYDQTGPWKPAKPGQHSSFAYAKLTVGKVLQRKVPASKILLGMPTYGYAFMTGKDGKPTARDFGWPDLLRKYPEKRDADVAGPGAATAEGIWYYNGLPTVRQKVAWAAEQHLAGIGVWHGTWESKDPATSFWFTVRDANR